MNLRSRKLALLFASFLTTLTCGAAASDSDDVGTLEWIVGISWGDGNVDGVGESARFAGPLRLAPSNDGGLLIADEYADTLRRVDPDLRVTTLAGQAGVGAYRDGPADRALFSSPMGMAQSANGTIYVADRYNDAIRSISPDGTVGLLAGKPGEDGDSDGRGTQARFRWPVDVALDGEGRIWVADHYNEAVRIVSPNGYVTTWPVRDSQAPQIGGNSAVLTDTRFPGIDFIASAPDGTMVVAGEWGISRIDGDTATRVVTSISAEKKQEIISMYGDIPSEQLPAWAAAELALARSEGTSIQSIGGLAVKADGTLLVADKTQGLVFEVSPDGTAKVVAGRSTDEPHAGVEGKADVALLNQPGSIAVDSAGNVFVANQEESVQQILPDGEVRNVLGFAPGYRVRDLDASRVLHGSCDVAIQNKQGETFVVQRLDNTIVQFDANGNRLRQFGQDTASIRAPESETYVDGGANVARFHYPQDIEFGRAGEVFVADQNGIRRIAADGEVSTLIGNAGTPDRRDGDFERASFFRPYRLAFDGRNTLYVLDNSPYIGGGPVGEVVRKLDLDTHEISTVIDANSIQDAYLTLPPEKQTFFRSELKDIGSGPDGSLYVLGEHGDLYVWTPAQGLRIARFPGSLMPADTEEAETILDAKGKPVENHLVRSASISGRTEHLAVDAFGNAYVTDASANVVLRIDGDNNVDIIVGTLGVSGNTEGPLPGSLENPEGLSITPQGDLLITVLHSGVIRVRQPHKISGVRIGTAEHTVR